MAELNVNTLEKTVHETNKWLKEIDEKMHFDNNREKAYKSLRSFLHAMRDRLMPEEAVNLGSQLPTMVRGIYFEGWNMSKTPVKIRHKEDFLQRINENLGDNASIINSEMVATNVFDTLKNNIDKGQIEKIKDLIPNDINELWSEKKR
ncbi:MAG: DUF2267 domain-containing protein [Candidatus Kapaibacterium sp.]